MSAIDITVLAAICVAFVLLMVGLASWSRRRFMNRDRTVHPDGPNAALVEDAAFNDGVLIYRVTALPARDPVWLFRRDSALGRPSAVPDGDPITAIVGAILAAIALGLARGVVASLDRRWKVVVDRKDRPIFATFHAVHVEVYNSKAEAESRRDEIVHGWTPNWKYAAMPRLSRRAIRAVRDAAPAYVPEPQARMSRQARISRRIGAIAVTATGVLFTLFWVIGAGGVAAEGVSGAGTMGDYIGTIIMCVVFVLVGAAITVAGWSLRPRRQ